MVVFILLSLYFFGKSVELYRAWKGFYLYKKGLVLPNRSAKKSFQNTDIPSKLQSPNQRSANRGDTRLTLTNI